MAGPLVLLAVVALLAVVWWPIGAMPLMLVATWVARDW